MSSTQLKTVSYVFVHLAYIEYLDFRVGGTIQDITAAL